MIRCIEEFFIDTADPVRRLQEQCVHFIKDQVRSSEDNLVEVVGNETSQMDSKRNRETLGKSGELLSVALRCFLRPKLLWPLELALFQSKWCSH